MSITKWSLTIIQQISWGGNMMLRLQEQKYKLKILTADGREVKNLTSISTY